MNDKLTSQERSDALYKMFDKWLSPALRSAVIAFIILIEICLIVLAFRNQKVDVAILATITIMAALPILVMRAFDITALSLTKEGIVSSMSSGVQPEATSVKFISIETGTSVTVQTDKFLSIELNGVTYKIPIVQ